MARPTRKCALCLETKLLEWSHFLPSGLYDYCRGENGGEPIKATFNVVFSTSRQTAAYLLCGDCEDVINEGGESWMLPKLAQWSGPFPLYDLVTAGPYVDAGEGSKCYLGVQNSNINCQKITHFAMGIYFKAAVHSWSGSQSEPRINLGPYSEEVRKYLLGGPFAANMSLVVTLSPREDAYIGFNEPYEAVRELTHRLFMFCIPGMWFCLMVGKLLPEEARGVSITAPDGAIIVSSEIGKKGQTLAIKALRKGRKTKSYIQAMQKVWEWKKRPRG